MNSLHDLVTRLDQLQVQLWEEDGYLSFSAPDGVMTDALLDELRDHKEQLLAMLRQVRADDQQIVLRLRSQVSTFPVSPAQRRLWFMSQVEGANVAYSMPFVTALRGPLAVGALTRSFDEHRAAATRACARRSRGRDDGPVQVIHPPSPLAVPVIDLGHLDGAAQAQALAQAIERRVDQAVHQPFDIERGPLLRVQLLRQSATEHVLILVVHHIVADGWSIGVLLRELAALYEAFHAGRPSPLPPLLAAVRRHQPLAGGSA